MLAQVKPNKLPRRGAAPIVVFVAGHLQNADGTIPPQLQKMRILVNATVCCSPGACRLPHSEVQPAATERALANCHSAPMLIFNGKEAGHSVILAHVFTDHPFNSSFVSPFTLKQVSNGFLRDRTARLAPSAGRAKRASFPLAYAASRWGRRCRRRAR